MALSDIINRIESNAGHQARETVDAANAEAARMLAEAEAAAKRDAEDTLERARKDAEAGAATVRANARLAARDMLLGRKSELMGEALGRAEEALVALPDDEYAALLAREVVGSARGGEKVLLGKADAKRLGKALPEAVSWETAGSPPELEYSKEPAPFERGVLLLESRSSVEVSPASLIASRRDDLSAAAAKALFGEASG